MKIASIVFATVFVCFVVATSMVRQSVHSQAFHFVCEMVEAKVLVFDQELLDWAEQCRSQADGWHVFSSRKSLLDEMHLKLLELEISHLDVYSPVEEKRMWQGRDVDTGIRTRQIEGYLVVYEILPGSAGEKSGVKVGDIVVLVDGEQAYSSWSVIKAKQQLKIVRHKEGKKETLDIFVSPTTLKVDSAPQFVELKPSVAWLKISSFRAEYFTNDSWKGLAQKLSRYKKVIVDLRGNSGGNFVALLRALSPFTCGEANVGRLLQPRRPLNSEFIMGNDINEEAQLSALEQYKTIHLQTFAGYPCSKAKVVVITDEDTASVAEIFAQAMKELRGSQIIGIATAGDVVLGVWYELGMLGPGYSLSIPEAKFYSQQGVDLEAQGVWPDISLSYEFKDAITGKDTFLERASGSR